MKRCNISKIKKSGASLVRFWRKTDIYYIAGITISNIFIGTIQLLLGEVTIKRIGLCYIFFLISIIVAIIMYRLYYVNNSICDLILEAYRINDRKQRYLKIKSIIETFDNNDRDNNIKVIKATIEYDKTLNIVLPIVMTVFTFCLNQITLINYVYMENFDLFAVTILCVEVYSYYT